MNETIELLKQASYMEAKTYNDYITSFSSSAIASLVKGGVPFEKAASLVKEACASDLKAQNLMTNIKAFEKAAEAIEDLLGRVESLEKTAEHAEEIIQKDESNPLNKLASIGFSQEEIDMMSQLPENLLTKVASTTGSPVGMGSGVGLAHEKTDPLLEFIVS